MNPDLTILPIDAKHNQQCFDVPTDDIKRILIIRLSAMGDIVMASGLIPALRTKYPNAEIYWLSDSAMSPMLTSHQGLAGVITWDKQKWKSLFKSGNFITLSREIGNLARTLRSYNFSLSLDAQGLLKTGVLSFLSGARHKVAFHNKEFGHWFAHHVLHRDFTDSRMSSEYRDLARFLRCDDDDYLLGLDIPHEVQTQVEAMLPAGNHKTSQKRVVLAPFTTREQKCWPVYHWSALIEYLNKRNYQVVVLGGPGDVDSARRLLKDHSSVINLVGKTSLLQSYAVITRANQLIGVDTGLTHMGVAADVPTIAIFGSTCPYLKPLSQKARILYQKRDCSPCHRTPQCGGLHPCMSDITPERVLVTMESIH